MAQRQNQSNLLDMSTINAAADGVLKDGGEIDGCVLEIHIRNGGQSKHGYIRYNGTPFGEKRTERIALGSLDQGLRRLRRERVACEDLILQGKSPKRFRGQQQEQRRAAGMTFADALEEFWQHGVKVLWNDSTRKYNERVRKKHLNPMPLMSMPLESIRAPQIDESIGEKWRTMSGIGPRMRSLVHSAIQYQIDKDDGIYRGPNPASWHKTSSASRRLGDQLPSFPHPGFNFRDIAKVVGYFCAPQDHWVPGYLTTMQAAFAYERDPKAIRESYERGHFNGVIKAPPVWKTSSNLIPIEELTKKYGPFVHEPKPHEQASATMHSRLARFLIYTPVRASNGCDLRWRNIREDKGTIEYLPKRKDPKTGLMLPSEHKLGWKFPVPYVAILTDNLRALIEAQRQQQIRDGIKIEPDGFVFIHGKSQTGNDSWFRKKSSHRTLDDHYTRAFQRLNARGDQVRLVPDDAKKPTVHGLRATFTTWAKEHGHTDDAINLSLGHIIPAIAENQTNWSYFYNVEVMAERIEMTTKWEKHCLRDGNVVRLPRQRRTK